MSHRKAKTWIALEVFMDLTPVVNFDLESLVRERQVVHRSETMNSWTCALINLREGSTIIHFKFTQKSPLADFLRLDVPNSETYPVVPLTWT